ncbi:type II toxin-antitoxin system HipA family toxin [Rhodoferax antarcticus]|uniref:Ser/Thr phosphatidylinositol kinase HipA, toxin component of HipAB toxin-antitoxin module n=1 Tax=Rhodoferax antarcticus ANT.BR TaxID=1111071 RepID=A0A1Q8YHD4_9BURK|nr:HipA domain-containing protein [Rhodoferax antarcticus]APW45108.1 phosphatidylinositol kinase [Rhodoferax antarcticus]OLP07329.1 Ser/Thr phosphatidylinositol kinase HipA, toxin component of HipAB toxin-antitoxin module [Rhodoferax antarcticus ANT.BR]
MRHDNLYLWVLIDPAAPRYVGRLRLVDAGKGVSLQYGTDWLASGFPLSEDLLLVDIEQLPRFKGMAVGAVDDARPDRWGERVIQYLDRPARLSIMEYLFYAGDDRFGALGVSTSADTYLPRTRSPLPRLAQAQALSEIVHKVSAKEPVNDMERKMLSAGGSFGGAKPKALIDIAGEQWVIKFFNNEPIDVPLIEHASMTLAKLAGITVAETQVVPLVGEHALAVRRFDRNGTQRIHCISAGTALRAETVAGQEPQMGYPGLAQLLRRAGVAQEGLNLLDMQELFRRMVFNILIDNTDDHEKNHTLMVVEPTRQGRYRLAPAYDVLTTNSGQGYQEFTVGDDQRDSTLSNAMSQCELFGFIAAQAAAEVVRVIQVVDGWRKHFAQCGVSDTDLESLAERIDGDQLLSQRQAFNPADYAAPVRQRRRSPFAK